MERPPIDHMLGFRGTTCYPALLKLSLEGFLSGMQAALFSWRLMAGSETPHTQCLSSGFRGSVKGAQVGWGRGAGSHGGRHTDEKGPRVWLGRKGANPKSLGHKISRLGSYCNA